MDDKASETPELPDQAEAVAVEPEKRKRGRPKGLPKTGGRVKHEWTQADLRNLIMAELGDLEGLLDIAKRKQLKVSGSTGKSYLAYPTIPETLKAWELLLRKALPDLQGVTLAGGDDGKPIQVEHSGDLTATIFEILGMPLPQQPAASTIDLRGLGPELASAAPPTAARGLNAEPLAATDYAALTKELAEDGVEVLDPTRDHNQGILGRDPAVGNGGVYQMYPGPSAPAGMAGRRDERPPKGMCAPAGREMEAGERVMVKGCDGSLEYTGVTNGDGRHRFWILDKHGQRLCAILGQAEAEAKLRELSEKGTITR